MAKLPIFDVRVVEALADAPSDPQAAAEALLLAAEYLRSGTPMPEALAEHLASALETVLAAPEKQRGSAFLMATYLRYPGRRPDPPMEVGELGTVMRAFIGYLRRGKSENDAAMSLTAEPRFVLLSESKVKRLYKKYGQAFERDLDESQTT